MSDLASIAQRLQRLEDIEAIKQLKYRYWRHLDLKEWDELATCFVADATVSYGSGQYEFKGVEAIMRFLRESLGKERGSVTIHHGHHPEINLTGAACATGTWALYNYMFNEKQRRGIRIGAYYHDDLVKVGGEWKFRHIGYTTLFHEEWHRDDVPSLKLLAGG
jgi:hypothetical protein